MTGLFDGFDQDRLDALTARFSTALIALAGFATPEDDADLLLYEAAFCKALLENVGVFLIHPHQDAAQYDELLEGVIAFLRADLARP